eukprot:jgi/Bigna1/142502/aug1.70_g17210
MSMMLMLMMMMDNKLPEIIDQEPLPRKEEEIEGNSDEEGEITLAPNDFGTKILKKIYHNLTPSLLNTFAHSSFGSFCAGYVLASKDEEKTVLLKRKRFQHHAEFLGYGGLFWLITGFGLMFLSVAMFVGMDNPDQYPRFKTDKIKQNTLLLYAAAAAVSAAPRFYAYTYTKANTSTH